MNSVKQGRRAVVVAVFSVLVGGWPWPVVAQAPRLAKEPILIIRSHGLHERAALDYIRELHDQLQVGRVLMQLNANGDLTETLSRHPAPVSGQLVYLAQGLLPGVESIQFRQVADEADFERLIRVGAGHAGNGRLEGGNGRYTQVITSTWLEDLTQDDHATEDDHADNRVTVSVGVSSSSGASLQVSGTNQQTTIVEKDGRKYREHRTELTQYYRYQDGFLFHSTCAALPEMDLPTAETLLSRDAAAPDAELTVHPDRIPPGIRQLFWNSLSSTTNAGLQQRDGEDAIDYGVRRAGGDLGLAALQMLLFDVDHLSGQLHLAAEGRPVVGELLLRARGNSRFSAQLTQLSTARSRLAPLLDDAAGLTLHASIQLPEAVQPLIAAVGEFVETRLIAAAGVDATLPLAGHELQKTLSAMAEHRHLELLLQIGWADDTGCVIYGGLRVDDNPELLRTLYDLLRHADPAGTAADYVSLLPGELPMIRVQLPAVEVLAVRISDVFLTHADGCLWFAAGTQQAQLRLQSAVAACRDAGVRPRTPLLTGSLNLDQWLAWPQDEPTGIAQLPYLIDASLTDALAVSMDGRPEVPRAGDRYSGGSAELVPRVIQMGGTMTGQIALETDDSGCRVHGELGAALCRYVIARWLSTLDQLDLGAPPAVPADTPEPTVRAADE